MTFEEILDQAVAMLQRRGQMTYRTLKRQFTLDDEALEDLKEELLYSHPVRDDNGRGLIWTGDSDTTPEPVTTTQRQQPTEQESPSTQPEPTIPDAERRQLTVMFCDLADSTRLSGQLDPEDLRDVIRAYQSTSAEVIERYDGYIAQHLGDGLMVYFGWPQAHEDDAHRGVHAGLGILEAIGGLNERLEQEKGIRLAIRIGIHTGLVVVGEIGQGVSREHLALGETPNIASRIEGIAAPNTIAISAATYQLVQGYFVCEDLGLHTLKGVDEPQQVYRVIKESDVQSRFDIATARGLTPLVGREQEVGLLVERWRQVKDGHGQVILLSGEAGIGKSRLAQVIKTHVAEESHRALECRSSPYYRNTPFYPLIDLLQRSMQGQADETPARRLATLEHILSDYRLPLAETVLLLAPLLSLPLPEDRYPSLQLTPQRRRQKTLETLLAMLLEQAEHQALLFILEDLHWTDPTTLEWLNLLVEQVPTTSLLIVLTCRPEFQSPWGLRTRLTPIALNRFTRLQIERMVTGVTGGKTLPAEVMQHLVEKTDGVPLYVEEMFKAVLEASFLKEADGRYTLRSPLVSLTIPATLQASLTARLDRLGTAKGVAQLGAVLGRQFSFKVLQAVSPLDDVGLQRELQRLVEAELLYQRGLGSQATYVFKHALIQDTAYQTLLRRTRQAYHEQIAQVFEKQFPELAESQPELLAYHFTEAQVNKQAVHYWYKAGRRTAERSAYDEAISHFKKGLEVLSLFPDTSERAHQELTLQMGLGRSLMLAKGYATPELEPVYLRAQKLCEQVGDTRRLIGASTALWSFYFVGGQLSKARKMAEQDMRMASNHTDSRHLVAIHNAMGQTLTGAGELVQAQAHFEEAIALYDRHDHRLKVTGVQDYGMTCRSYLALVLWRLGYPDQALRRSQEALALAHEVEHPYSLAAAMTWSAMLNRDLWQTQIVLERTEAALTLATEHKFAFWLSQGMIFRGWALGIEGQAEEGVEQMRQGLAVVGTTWAEAEKARYPVMLAEVYRRAEQTEKGLDILGDALAQIDRNEYRLDESERYRLKGALLLQQSLGNQTEAESCFKQAISIAQFQQAKSLELRAATSLARLWQSQRKHQEAYNLLQPVYGWFTEGFDTADLKDARALLMELEK